MYKTVNRRATRHPRRGSHRDSQLDEACPGPSLRIEDRNRATPRRKRPQPYQC